MQRLITLFLFFTLVTTSLVAQEGEKTVFLDGNSFSNGGFIQARAAYDFSERLTAGAEVSAFGQLNFAPFLRYYFLQGGQWRLYTEAGIRFRLGGGNSMLTNYGLRLGAEKPIDIDNLLNLELLYNRSRIANSGDISDIGGLNLIGSINTRIGGPAGKAVAQGNVFKPSTILLGNRLGSINFQSQRNRYSTGLALSPRVSYFITDRLLGTMDLQLLYNRSVFNFSGATFTSSSLRLDAAIGARYYLNTGSLFNTYTAVELSVTTFSENDTNRDDLTGLDAVVEFGSSIFLNASCSLDVGLVGRQNLVESVFSNPNLLFTTVGRLNFWF